MRGTEFLETRRTRDGRLRTSIDEEAHEGTHRHCRRGLVLVFAGQKTADEGLDAAVVRSNAILRAFRVINGAAGQGEI